MMAAIKNVVRVVGAGVMNVAKSQRQSSKATATTTQKGQAALTVVDTGTPFWKLNRMVPRNSTVGAMLGEMYKHGYKPGSIIIRRSDLKASDMYIDTGDMGMITRLNPMIQGKENIYAPLRVTWMSGKSDDWWPMDVVLLSTIKDVNTIKKEAGIL